MFFLFGTTDKERSRGFVVDHCGSCRTLRPLEVLGLYNVWHVYFIPLGRGSFQGDYLRCSACGSAREVGDSYYPEALSKEALDRLGLDEALRRTNPALAQRFARIEELTSLRQAPPYRSVDPDDSKLKRAIRLLRELELRGVDTDRLVARFSGWARLDPAQRDVLVAQLEGFAEGAGVTTGA